MGLFEGLFSDGTTTPDPDLKKARSFASLDLSLMCSRMGTAISDELDHPGEGNIPLHLHRLRAAVDELEEMIKATGHETKLPPPEETA
jgi:hypothetical protein